MKIFFATLASLFLLFAVVQYNDPDPWLWIAIYLTVAVSSGLTSLGRYNRWLAWGTLAAALVWMGLLLPDFIHWIQMGAPSIVGSMKAEAQHIELTREFLGLVLCVLVQLSQIIWAWRKKSNA
ncbi:MAG: transmembrane 220 family protein [Saprospiraceae bacterium]|nr:transmembrane 220 family protein [Saprospiraceae bacterium]